MPGDSPLHPLLVRPVLVVQQLVYVVREPRPRSSAVSYLARPSVGERDQDFRNVVVVVELGELVTESMGIERGAARIIGTLHESWIYVDPDLVWARWQIVDDKELTGQPFVVLVCPARGDSLVSGPSHRSTAPVDPGLGWRSSAVERGHIDHAETALDRKSVV